MKNTKKLLTFIVSLILLLTSFTTFAYAEEADQNALDARNGVVKVLVYYNDQEEWGKLGSGFLINENTIITSANNVSDESSEKKVTKVTVVAVADIEIEAHAVSISAERGFAVLELDQQINQRSILKLGAPEGFDTTSSVYALGFPWIKEYTSGAKINYSPEDVVVTDGAVSSISNIGEVKYVQHSAKTDNGNAGGPLVASTPSGATVVGVNITSLENVAGDTTYYYSVHIDEIIEALDTLGITYTAYEAAAAAPAEGDGEATTAAAKPASSGVAQWFKDNGKMVAIIAIAVVILIVAIIIIVAVVKKKDNNRMAPVSAAGFNPPPAPSGPVTMTGPNNNFPSGDATTLLGADPNATTVLGAAGASAHLYRISNNEKIQITKSLFKIGKDASRVDYCITGNSAVSRYHAAIISKDGKYFIEDQGATNGTYVNDSKIPAKVETQLINGAKIRLADEKFEFRI